MPLPIAAARAMHRHPGHNGEVRKLVDFRIRLEIEVLEPQERDLENFKEVELDTLSLDDAILGLDEEQEEWSYQTSSDLERFVLLRQVQMRKFHLFRHSHRNTNACNDEPGRASQ
jgi:hypothetical protein